MPKQTQNLEIKDGEPIRGERAPRLLNEEGIAKLQAAVDAARRKRLAPHDPPTDPKNSD